MYRWERWLFFIIPAVFAVIIGSLFFYIKRHRGHGYFLSKFSAFTRIRFDSLERCRQTYCPNNEKCNCHPKTSAAHIEPNLSCPHRSPTLYMSFAGAAMIVGGVRTTEWRTSMRELHRDTSEEFDALFFTDPAQCFYLQDPYYKWDGIDYYRRLISIYVTLYQRVILIGASLGGSIVCMTADLATLAIAFNPILDPALLGLAWRFMGAYCPARQAQIVRDQVQSTIEKIHKNSNDRHCVLHIHWSQFSRSDHRQAQRILGQGKYQNSPTKNFVASVLNFDVNHFLLSSSTGVHIWFHPCSNHALAMHLKKTSQLLPLLRCHLIATSLGLQTISQQCDAKQQDSLGKDSLTIDGQQSAHVQLQLF